MKNTIKTIAATAMALTLLGTGTSITKNIAPQFDNSITASAETRDSFYYQAMRSSYNGVTIEEALKDNGVTATENLLNQIAKANGIPSNNKNTRNAQMINLLSMGFLIKPVSEIFVDVQGLNDNQIDAIQYVVNNDIMVGKGNDPNGSGKQIFDPNTPITRAEFVQTLYNYMGKPYVYVDENNLPFSDMKKGQWYNKAIVWAIENGITAGYGNGKFGISDSITREQSIQMLYKFAFVNGTNTSIDGYVNDDSISDPSQISSWAKTAIYWAISQNILDERDSAGKRIVNPQGITLRVEFADFLQNELL